MRATTRYAAIDTRDGAQVIGVGDTLEETMDGAREYARERMGECQVLIRARTYFEDGTRVSEIMGQSEKRVEEGYEITFRELEALAPELMREAEKERTGAFR